MFPPLSAHGTLAVQVCGWGAEEKAEPGEVPAERTALGERERGGEHGALWDIS